MQKFSAVSPVEHHCHGKQEQLEFQAQERIKYHNYLYFCERQQNTSSLI